VPLGRVHRVKFDKDYFIGKNALQKQNEEGIFRRLVHFTMDDDHDTENDVWVKALIHAIMLKGPRAFIGFLIRSLLTSRYGVENRYLETGFTLGQQRQEGKLR
jgi:glycine cleavage system aminomethyltransferase T